MVNSLRTDTYRILALLGKRFGDNAQVLALADALSAELGQSYDQGTFIYNQLFRLPNTLLDGTLYSVSKKNSDYLSPPWPNLVISVGRRSVAPARWLQKQSDGITKLVHIGRPRAPLNWFDLVITTPQYSVPAAANVVELLLPMARQQQRNNEECFYWQRQFADLPRPWIGMLVGGATYPYRFDGALAVKMAQQAIELAKSCGGSLLVVTSPRTKPDVVAGLRHSLSGPHYLHVWGKNDGNPYQSILALADQFIVTCESSSLLADACRNGKPVYMFALMHVMDKIGWSLANWPKLREIGSMLVTPDKNFTALHERLIQDGHAAWLGEPEPVQWQAVPDRVPEVVARVLKLMKQA